MVLSPWLLLTHPGGLDFTFCSHFWVWWTYSFLRRLPQIDHNVNSEFVLNVVLGRTYQLAGDATIFPTLNATSAYWQVGIAEENRDKTAITSHYVFLPLACTTFSLKIVAGRFNQQWTFYEQNSCDSFPLSISKILSYFFVCQKSLSILFHKC